MYCAVEFVSVIEAPKLVAIEVESRSYAPALMCTRSIDDLLPHALLYHAAIIGDMVKCSFNSKCSLSCPSIYRLKSIGKLNQLAILINILCRALYNSISWLTSN